MTDKPDKKPSAPAELELNVVPAVVETALDEPGLSRVLLRVMDTDPESNVVFGNTPPGEAEDWAAAVAFAEYTGSPVILRYENLKNMAKRAEKANLLDKILNTVKAIGKPSDAKPGFLSSFRRTGP